MNPEDQPSRPDEITPEQAQQVRHEQAPRAKNEGGVPREAGNARRNQVKAAMANRVAAALAIANAQRDPSTQAENQGLMEERLQEDQNGITLPLKKGPGEGKEVDVQWALERLDALEGMQEEQKESFATLIALAHGRREEANAASIPFLKRLGFVTNDGSAVVDKFRDLILSSEETTKDGIVLCNPFERNVGHKRIVELTVQANNHTSKKFFERVEKDMRRQHGTDWRRQ
jgi:hypothetical protein